MWPIRYPPPANNTRQRDVRGVLKTDTGLFFSALVKVHFNDLFAQTKTFLTCLPVDAFEFQALIFAHFFVISFDFSLI